MSRLINMWEVSFFSEEEDDMVEVCYYTYTDDSQLAHYQYEEDEPGVPYDTFMHDGTITEEQMIDWYGDLNLVLDKEDRE